MKSHKQKPLPGRQYPSILRKEFYIPFWRILTGIFRAEPNFIIIGAAKSGTSSLYTYLTKHPLVHPAYKKEIHYFDLNFSKSLNWYRAHFSYQPFLKIKPSQKKTPCPITGEATPYYLCHPLAPKRIHDVIPHIKLIVMLRDPVDRAYSHYQHAVRHGLEKLSFEEAIFAEATRLHGETEKLKRDENYHSFSHRHHSYLLRGRYAEQIEMWYQYFSPTQILVVESETFFSAPEHTLKQVVDFLGLPPFKLPEYKVLQKGSYPKMQPSTREYLANYYKPYNIKLFELVGRRFNWSI